MYQVKRNGKIYLYFDDKQIGHIRRSKKPNEILKWQYCHFTGNGGGERVFSDAKRQLFLEHLDWLISKYKKGDGY